MLTNSAISPARGPRPSARVPLLKRRWLRRLTRALAALVLLPVLAAGVELWLEARDARVLTADDTFAQIPGARIRYRLMGSGQPVVFLTGMASALEQFDRAQLEVSSFATALTYDRGGAGFSRSSAYDAEQQAAELAALLTALDIRQPIVLVAFSSSASVGRVFVDRYRQRVSALILLDPYLPELEERTRSPWRARSYIRWLVADTVYSLFGVKRLSRWIEETRGRAEVLSLPHERKARAVLGRFWHWWAVDGEALAEERTNRQTAAAGGLSDLPLIVLAGDMTTLGELGRHQDDAVRELAARSRYGRIHRLTAADHGEMVWNEPNYVQLITAISDTVSR